MPENANSPAGKGRSGAAPKSGRASFWLITVATVAMVAATLGLGWWQLSRAAQKEALLAAIDAQQARPALGDAELLARADLRDELHRKVELRGLWLTPHTVYLDNRQMHGLPGFYVLTPFALEDGQQVVMVERGWLQRNFVDRERLEPVQTPAGLVQIEGRLAAPPARLLALGQEDPSTVPGAAGASLIRQNLDLESFRQATGLPMRTDVVLRQTGPASDGLLRDWPAPALGIERHYGYAFQWFGLATLIVVLYVWFQLLAPLRRARRVRR